MEVYLTDGRIDLAWNIKPRLAGEGEIAKGGPSTAIHTINVCMRYSASVT